MKQSESVKKTHIMFIFILGFLAICYVLFFDNEKKQQPVAENGILDLSNWNFSKDGPVQLNGKWELYWEQLLGPADFRYSNGDLDLSGYLSVPNVWNDFSVDNSRLNGKGYGTYRLKVKIADEQGELGLKLLTMSTAYNLTVNNQKIASSGIVGDSSDTSKPEYDTQTVVFTPTSDEIEIIVQVSNYTYARGGIWTPITLGTDHQVQDLTESHARREMLYFGIMVSIMCYYFALFLAIKKSRDLLFAALALLVVAIRILVTGEYYITNLFGGIPFSTVIIIEYFTVFWGPVASLLFFRELFPKEFSSRVVRIFAYIAAAFSALTLLLPLYIFTKFVFVAELFGISVFIYSFIVVRKSIKLKRNEAVVLLHHSAILLIAYLFEELSKWHILPPMTYSPIEIGVMISVALQVYIISKRYARALKKSKDYFRKVASINLMMDKFLVLSSHELRTPISGIISISQSMLRDNSLELPPQVQMNISHILRMSKRLDYFSKDMLDFSRTKSDEMKLHLVDFELQPLLINVRNEMSWSAEKRILQLILLVKKKQPALLPINIRFFRCYIIFWIMQSNSHPPAVT